MEKEYKEETIKRKKKVNENRKNKLKNKRFEI